MARRKKVPIGPSFIGGAFHMQKHQRLVMSGYTFTLAGLAAELGFHWMLNQFDRLKTQDVGKTYQLFHKIFP
ncbi:MAG: hypothetical protein OEL85_00350 [Desulfobulbaceae bacterium]|nr:hypothetical protein [Desulfobulbaceae bacterium]